MADISHIHPIFKFKLDLILADLKLLGWEPIIASGVRTPAEQAEKVKQGFSQTMHSWHVLGTAQMIPAGRAAIDEVHGSAADVVDRRYGWDGRAQNKDF